jgi:hypothetical protein
MKTEIYKNFKISYKTILRNKYTNGFGGVTSKRNGNLTKCKEYTIEYLGSVSDYVKEMKDFIRVDEFKSLPEVKRYIDNGGFDTSDEDYEVFIKNLEK